MIECYDKDKKARACCICGNLQNQESNGFL